MKRALILMAVMAMAWPASAEDIVSGVGQDVIQIDSKYTGSNTNYCRRSKRL